MAKAVEFRQFTPRNSREDLIRKLEQAPEEHVEALLSAYELLQRMHEKGLIELANGLLSASDTVVDKLADVASSKQVVNALRVALMLMNLLSSVDPDRLHELLSPPSDSKPPSMWKIGKEAMTEDGRRGLSTAVGLLNLFGSAVGRQG